MGPEASPIRASGYALLQCEKNVFEPCKQFVRATANSYAVLIDSPELHTLCNNYTKRQLH